MEKSVLALRGSTCASRESGLNKEADSVGTYEWVYLPPSAPHGTLG
jgi:hypothetical protein